VNVAPACEADYNDALLVGLVNEIDGVLLRNEFGDHDDGLHAGTDGIKNRGRSETSRDEHDRRICPLFFRRFSHRVVDRHSVDGLSTLSRSGSGDHLGPVLEHSLGMKFALIAGNPLHHHPRIAG
jgi:hypothetical protein